MIAGSSGMFAETLMNSLPRKNGGNENFLILLEQPVRHCKELEMQFLLRVVKQ